MKNNVSFDFPHPLAKQLDLQKFSYIFVSTNLKYFYFAAFWHNLFFKRVNLQLKRLIYYFVLIYPFFFFKICVIYFNVLQQKKLFLIFQTPKTIPNIYYLQAAECRKECGSNHALLTAKEAISLWVLGARKVCKRDFPKIKTFVLFFYNFHLSNFLQWKVLFNCGLVY